MAVASLAVRISAQTAEFQKGFADLTRTVDKFGNDFQGLTSKVSTLAKGMAGALSVGEVTHFTKSLLDGAGAIVDMSTRPAWRFANAAFKLGSNLSGGSKSVEQAVRELGLSFADLRRQSPDKQFDLATDALHRMENPQDRNRLALELFGRSVQELMPAIVEGYLSATSARPTWRLPIGSAENVRSCLVRDTVTRERSSCVCDWLRLALGSSELTLAIAL